MKQLDLLESCTHYTVTRNRYGDMVTTSTETIPCLFRDMALISTNNNSREEQQIDGIFWFAPTSTVVMGDLISYGGQLYRVIRRIKAKALVSDGTPHFIKCQVVVYRSLS